MRYAPVLFHVVSSYHSIVMLSPNYWEVYLPVYVSNVQPGPMPGRFALGCVFVDLSVLV